MDKNVNKMFLGSVSQELLEFKVNIISNEDCESWLKGNISTQRLVDFKNLINIFSFSLFQGPLIDFSNCSSLSSNFAFIP